MRSSGLRLVAAMTRTSTRVCERIGADALDLAVLEEAEQQRLHAQAHLRHLVEEDRAAVRHFEQAHGDRDTRR